MTSNQPLIFSNFVLVAFALTVCLSLTGCDAAKNQLKSDRAANLEMQDYKDALAPRLPEVDEDKASGDSSSIPGLQPYVAQGSEAMKSMPLVSISVNQSVPLRDILFELAQQADYDLELDPGIRGSIIFTARNRPFDQVIERISDIAGLRYKFEDEVLRVEVDTPYNKTYKIDYLSYIRSNKGNVRNDIAVVSGDGADTGSSFEAASESEADFWGELDVNLQQILGGAQSSLKTRRDPRITAAEQNPEVAAIAPTTEGGQVQVSPPQAVLNVESLPVDEEEEASNRRGGQDDGTQTTFAINKQAGLVSVFANEKQQAEVQEYLRKVRRSATAQVLIEAKIMEVTLRDQYATGIDWRALDLLSGDGILQYGTSLLYEAGTQNLGLTQIPAAAATASELSLRNIPGRPTAALAGTSNFAVGFVGNDVEALIQAISGFGTIRGLASPRMTVLNNQSAVLNVATNQVFFEVDIDVTTEDGATQTDIDSDIRNVPEGVLVNVQPSVDLERGTISLAVRPTITNIVSEVPDPAVQFVTAEAGITGVQSLVPELNVQEIDTVIQVRSGQPIVMGGLLQDTTASIEEGVPILSEMPMFGSLFKQHNDEVNKTELVIFLKASILENPGETIHNTDRDLYRTFSGDRRPFKL